MAVTVKALNGSSAKSEEISVLNEWVKQAGTQSYLASFLNTATVEWLDRQIWGDVSCDLMARLTNQREATATVEALLTTAKTQLRDHEIKLTTAQMTAERMHIEAERAADAINHELQAAKNAAALLEAERDAAQAELEAMRRAMMKLACEGWMRGTVITPEALRDLAK